MSLFSIKLDDIEYRLAMEKLQRGVREGIVDQSIGVLPYQARLLIEQVIKFTPPKNEDQGRHAIRNDLLNIFQIHRRETIEALVEAGGNGGWEGWIHDDRRDVHLKLFLSGVIQTDAEAKTIHHSNLSARGRTRRLQRKYAIQSDHFLDYLESVYREVGKGKAGWLSGALAMGAKNIPFYVTRHGPGEGRFVNGLSEERPYLEFYNDTRWSIRQDEGQRIIDSAMRARLNAMERFYQNAMERAAKRAGFDVAA